ncbi:DEAD/DEAH box helicase [Cytophaga aurantiaca]|uniref:DEAD/DEAH box helicase n=1 Tax=Cytophaga aurantiaca TaxID=29530 RepID=UPI0003628FF7|nr:DEAD/DEAH box helicase [Cytophaga aurantiaca]
MLFQDLKLIDPILKALSEEGYTTPTPIQAQSIPLVLERKDLLGCAQTGTGKTAAFSIPILQILSEKKSTERKRAIRCLIVTPTRELAIQIGESLQAYGKYTGLTSTVIFGGVNQSRQVTALQHGVDILVATPGRLIDLMNQRYISLSNIEIFVLDEADRMLDMGFIHDVKRLLVSLPPRRQSLFFSATMPPEILRLASTILHDPSKVEVTPVSSTAETIKQFMYFVDRGNKNDLLVDVLKDPKIKTCLVFTRTKHVADKVVKMLALHNIKAEAIHGNKSQNARQSALTNFKAQTTRILVATDIAARGIDVDNLEYVINYEIPNVPETYVHRIGRTGRAGANGTAFSFCDAEEKEYLKDIEKLISIKIPVIDDHAYPLMDHNPPKTIQGGRQQRSSSPRATSSAGSGRSGGSSNKPAGSASRRPSSGGSSSSSSSRSRNDGPPKKRW